MGTRLLCVLSKEHLPGRDWRLRIEDWISLFQHVRRAGIWKSLLQCLYLDEPLLKQQKRKKLYGAKNSCIYVQLGQILDKKIPKTKTSLSLMKRLVQNLGVVNKNRVLYISPSPQYHQSHPSGPSPGHTPTRTSYKEQLAPPSRGVSQETCCFSSTPSLQQGTL